MDGGRTGDEAASTPIGDYGLIGNSRTAALVSKSGSIDWLCLPSFQGPSVFGALLDPGAGRFRVGPVDPCSATRRYLPSTPVLETTFRTPGGTLVLTDLMPVSDEEAKRRRPWPHHQVLRRLECVEGTVEVEAVLEPRPDYGRARPALQDRGRLGVWCQSGAEGFALLSDVPLAVDEAGCAARGRCELRRGDVRHLSLTYARGEPLVLLPLGEHAEELLRGTVEWWEAWSSRLRYDGPWRDAVLRSALTLKLLTYAPSGAVVAAPTTSLPEVPGGSRNWDYRYCWLRDASWTLRALFELGFSDEAEAFYDWILYATRTTRPEVQALYDLHGGSLLDEEELDHLRGWRGSRPVRVGNNAHGQLQLDAYGEVMAAAYEYTKHGGEMDSGDRRFLADLAWVAAEKWTEKDEGIWELRGGPRHNTYSKVMCWTALDRAVRLHDEGSLPDVPAERYRRVMAEIRRDVETRGTDPDGDRYVGTYDEALVDSALLRMPGSGYVNARDGRFRRTHRHIEETLSAGGPLLYRYESEFDDLEGREGAFDLVSFWAIECLALAGDVDDACERFEAMLGYGNDLGLFSEETDPDTGELLGNFPQGFTHIGLVNAALTIEACRDGGGRGTPWEHEGAPEGAEARGRTAGTATTAEGGGGEGRDPGGDDQGGTP